MEPWPVLSMGQWPGLGDSGQVLRLKAMVWGVCTPAPPVRPEGWCPAWGQSWAILTAASGPRPGISESRILSYRSPPHSCRTRWNTVTYSYVPVLGQHVLCGLASIPPDGLVSRYCHECRLIDGERGPREGEQFAKATKPVGWPCVQGGPGRSGACLWNAWGMC